MADEQRRPDVARARRDWIRHRLPAMQAAPDRLVFIDETSVKTNMTRTRGRAPKGKRLNAAAPFGRWSTQTFIAGLTADALIAPWIIPGAMNGIRHWARTNGAAMAHPSQSMSKPSLPQSLNRALWSFSTI